jgi:hypothetical protein
MPWGNASRKGADGRNNQVQFLGDGNRNFQPDVCTAEEVAWRAYFLKQV